MNATPPRRRNTRQVTIALGVLGGAGGIRRGGDIVVCTAPRCAAVNR